MLVISSTEQPSDYVFFVCSIHICPAWVYLIASEWSKYANANTCAVDWSKMAATNYIDASGRNAKLVGRQMVEFAKPLIRKGMIIQMTNVASHSLGAHVAGFFGRGFGGQINTIFGECQVNQNILFKQIDEDNC